MRFLGSLVLLWMVSCQGLTTSLRHSAFGGRLILYRQSTSFLGNALVESSSYNDDLRTTPSTFLVMRKQKASDRRTRRRQRGEIALEEAPVTAVATSLITANHPMQGAVWKAKSGVSGVRAAALQQQPPSTTSGGRGRSRKRTTFYQMLQHYHASFLNPLTSEYQAEVCNNAGARSVDLTCGTDR